jgi:hypothetical protein
MCTFAETQSRITDNHMGQTDFSLLLFFLVPVSLSVDNKQTEGAWFVLIPFAPLIIQQLRKESFIFCIFTKDFTISLQSSPSVFYKKVLSEFD